MRNIWIPAWLLYTSMYKMCLSRWKILSFIPKWMGVLGPRDIWPDPRSDSPTGCLATEREVEYFKRGCSFSRTRQLAGAMAFCKTKHKSQPHKELSTSRIQPVTSWQTGFHEITQIYEACSADQIKPVCAWSWSQLVMSSRQDTKTAAFTDIYFPFQPECNRRLILDRALVW